MTMRSLRLIQILILGTLLGACNTLEKAPHRLPAPKTDPVSEHPSESEDRAHAADNQGVEPRQGTLVQESGPFTAGPQTQEPDMPGQAQADGEGSPARTEDEIVATLDRKLEEDLRKYDEQIHEEFEKAQAERQAHEQTSGGGQDTAPGLEEDGTGTSPDGDTGPVAKAEHPKPDTEPENRAGRAQDRLGKGSHNMPPPADLPSGDDDDVVARQLREAAQKEQDPVLREKLWDEYREYKKQQAGANTPPSGSEY